MVDNKLELDEAQRAANFEAVKSNVDAQVDGAVVAEARRTVPEDHEQIQDIASTMRSEAVSEVAETHREVQRGRTVARISQVVDYLFFLLYGLLAIRLLLALFAAKQNAGFFQIIRNLTDPFYAPFRGLMASPSTPEGYTLALPIIVAIVVYMLIHLAINGLLRIFAHRKTSV